MSSVTSVVVDGRDDLELAFEVSDAAARLAVAHFRTGLATTVKADGTPVTEADWAVERLLQDMLSSARPEDALLGQEFGQVRQADRVWILDPIDGTSFFSRGDPNWRIHVAPTGRRDHRTRSRYRAGTGTLLVGSPRCRLVRVVVAT